MVTPHKQLNHFAIQVHPFVSTNMGAHLPAYSRHRQIVGLLKKSYDIPGISWFFTMDPDRLRALGLTLILNPWTSLYSRDFYGYR